MESEAKAFLYSKVEITCFKENNNEKMIFKYASRL